MLTGGNTFCFLDIIPWLSRECMKIIIMCLSQKNDVVFCFCFLVIPKTTKWRDRLDGELYSIHMWHYERKIKTILIISLCCTCLYMAYRGHDEKSLIKYVKLWNKTQLLWSVIGCFRPKQQPITESEGSVLFVLIGLNVRTSLTTTMIKMILVNLSICFNRSNINRG